MRLVTGQTLLLLILIQLCSAQEFDVEKLFDSQSAVDDHTELIDYLEQLQQSPLNVNTASAKELCTLPWVSPIVAVRIVQYRHDYGDFRRLEDIKNVHGVKPVYDKVSPFLKTGKHHFTLPINAQGRHRILSRAEKSKAFQENIYAGSREKVYNRCKGAVSDYARFGVLMEKDVGEKKWNDLSIGYLVINPGFSTTICVGHFVVDCGQGLVFSGPYKLFKGSDPIAPAKQRRRGLRPYLSTAENYAFQGIGVSSKIKHFEFFAFTSCQERDARIEDEHIVSLPETGLHRTTSENSTRDQLEECVHGLVVETNIGTVGSIGVLWQSASYNSIFPKREDVDRYKFYGDHNQVIGFNFDLSFGSMNTFGECAVSQSGGQAFLTGLWYDLSPFECVALYRYYDVNFHNFYAHGFGERSDTQNENGFYLGFRYHLATKTTLCCYIDQWQSPWPQTFIPMPSSGYDVLFSLEHKPSSFLSISTQFRCEIKDAGSSGEDQFGNVVRFITRPQRSKFRCQIDYNPHKKVRLRSRLEVTAFDERGQLISDDGKVGTLLYQDIRWQPNSFLTVHTRWSLFDAPSYDHRFYQFENDLPGVMRLKMLNGRGARWYVLCSCKLKKNVRLHIKYENLFVDDKSTIGSGNDIIYSQNENILSFQFDWLF